MFDGMPVLFCAGSSSSASPSSSSIALSSSSSAPPSSSSIAPSSSSVPTFACTMTATTGTVGVAITPAPAVTCNGSTVTTGLAWTPANYTPTAAGNVSVSVSASSGVCSGRVAQCGSIAVSAPTLACAMTATTGWVGTAISPAPAVTCNGSTVTAGLAWTPANRTPTAAGSVSVSVNASSGVCSGMAAQCGSVTVPDPLACVMTATTGWVGTAISPIPTVTCNGSTVYAGLTWTPASLIPTAGGSVPVSVSAGSGVCSGMAVGCGSVTVPVYSGKGNNISSYKTVRIGGQTWMAENLNYVVEGSKCYNNSSADCDKYGSLYSWATAMALPSSCGSNSCSSQIQSKHQGICPSGWHIPSDAEWGVLMTAVGGYETAGAKLKATSGWYNSGNGTDEYGFSALPGGFGYSDGSFDYVGYLGRWWSASEYSSGSAYYRFMGYLNDGTYWDYDGKSGLRSVRCVQD